MRDGIVTRALHEGKKTTQGNFVKISRSRRILSRENQSCTCRHEGTTFLNPEMTGQRWGPRTRTRHSGIEGLFGSNAGGKNLVVHAHPNLAEEAVYLSQASGDITRRVGEPRHEAYIARRPLRRGFVFRSRHR